MSKTQTTEVRERLGVPVCEKNPFVSNAVASTKNGVKRVTNGKGDKMLVVSQQSGEILGGAGFWQTQEVDKTQFVKLYINGVKALKELTNAGTKVFELLYLEVQKQIGKDTIFLSYNSVDQDVTPISRAVYQRGLKELVQKQFIAPKVDINMFFINPDFMWNGDRLAFVKEYRVKSVDDMERKDNLELPFDDINPSPAQTED